MQFCRLRLRWRKSNANPCYCALCVMQGIYPEIPIITEAVYAQVRDQN